MMILNKKIDVSHETFDNHVETWKFSRIWNRKCMLIELLNKNINVNSKHEFFASTFRSMYSKLLKNFD